LIQDLEYKAVSTFYNIFHKLRVLSSKLPILLLVLVIPNTTFSNPQDSKTSYSPLQTEEIHIFFHCVGVNYLQKETVQNFLNEKKEKLEQEGGKLFFLPLGKGNSPEEPISFRFNSGSFLWTQPSHLPQLHNSKKYQFFIGFNGDPYLESEIVDIDIAIFWVYDEPLPNSFRRLGNTHALACPGKENELGKLKLVFRGNRLIRKHFSYSVLENWLGDL
jgi:hypothetical protein